jgi:uncharacterized protein (DUF2062 family)
MIRFTKELTRRWLDTLLHIHDTPERTAAAYALGVFLGFSPFLGFHTVLAVILAFVLNLNRVAVLLGVYSNLPWIIAGYYAGTTAAAAKLLRVRVPPGFRERLVDLFELSATTREFWHQLGQLIEPLVLPYFIGSLVGAAILAGIAYPAALAFVHRARKTHLLHRHQTP